MSESHFKINYFMKGCKELIMMRLMRFVFFSALLFFTVLLAGHEVYASEADYNWIENTDGTVTITKYKVYKDNNHVVVPDQLGGKIVSEIGNKAFDNAHIIGVTLPDTVTSIGEWAFARCYNLQTVKLPSGLISIGNYAFDTNQISHIDLPDSLQDIGFSAFNNNKLTSLSLPDGIKSIGQFAFYKNNITAISIPDSITKLNQYVFGYNQLTSITIPKSVTLVDDYAFTGNLQLSEVRVLSSKTALYFVPFPDVGSQLTIYGHAHSSAQMLVLYNSKYKGYNFVPFKNRVVYNGNDDTGGSVPVDNNLYERWERATVLGNTGLLTKPGYRFDGWNTASDGSGEDYAVNSKVSIQEEDLILFAKWVPDNAKTPAVTDAFTAENRQSASGLVITPDPADPVDVMYYKISAIVGGTLYKHDGTTQVTNGDFITVAEGGAGLKFTPEARANSAAGDTFSFQVQAAPKADGTLLSNPVTASIHVTDVNDAPVATDDTLPKVMKGAGKIIIEFADLLMNDSAGPANESFQSLTIVAVGNAVGGTVEIINGHIEFDLDPAFVGTAKFSYTVQDDGKTDGVDDFKTADAAVSFEVEDKAAIPLANPAGGAVISGTKITLTSATEGALIYYTTDGTTPTNASTLYTGPIEITGTMTLKAVATKLWMLDSEVLTEQYTILPLEQVVKPLATPASGAVLSGTKVTLTSATDGAVIYYTTDGTAPTSASTLYKGPIEITDGMMLKAIAAKPGMRDSEVLTEQYTLLPLEQVAKPLANPASSAVVSGTKVSLTSTTDGAVIYYTTDGTTPTSASTSYTGPIEITGAMTLRAMAVKPGMLDSEVLTEQYTLLPLEQVVKPLATPAGGEVVSGTKVTLTSTTDGAVIYYTTDGTTPTSASTLYTGAIEITSAMTLKAIAAKPGMLDSEVLTEQYTILPLEQVAKPLANPAGGAVASGTEVTLTSSTEGAMIYYTTDGTIPTSASTLYTKAIEITGAMMLKAVAVKSGMLDSEVLTEQYTVVPIAAPTIQTVTAGDGFVTLNWTAVAATDTVTYTVYKVAGSAAPINPNEWVPVQTNVMGTTFTATGLTNGTSYTFAVKAFVAGNDSDFSNVATATPRTSGGNGGSGGGGGRGASTPNHVTSTNGIIAIPVGSSGKVSLDGEIIIDIPDGAAEQELRITIEKLSDTSDFLTDQGTFRSHVYEVLKNFSGNFKKPVTLSIKFDPIKVGQNDKVAIFYYDENKKTWMEVGGMIDCEWITVEVDHFTKFAVLAVTENMDGDGETPKQPSLSFTDIAGHWSEDFIIRAVAQKLVSGYPDGTFKPNNPVTRAEFTVMLAGALKLDGTGKALPFKDRDKIGAWAKRAVALAVQEEIVSGYEDGSFRPDARITRTEMALMIAKALKLSLEYDVPTGFADNRDIPKWAKGAVEAIRKLGIVSGRGNNYFTPNDTATRAEAVVMLLRMLEYKDNR
ncbi:chitobiase/beta-hexosaminidase C-terminal domain-containing protein [Paenibacillus sp. IITD108]|uniref:chitobiase/beta-hexosaminidase C-terminal domain-containing protein n=1 Tax=Paenibacillus sp. IITD108 TaxID=3116649 RepID=UPI002F42502C